MSTQTILVTGDPGAVARALLDAADRLGLQPRVVATITGGFVVPDAVATEAGYDAGEGDVVEVPATPVEGATEGWPTPDPAAAQVDPAEAQAREAVEQAKATHPQGSSTADLAPEPTPTLEQQVQAVADAELAVEEAAAKADAAQAEVDASQTAEPQTAEAPDAKASTAKSRKQTAKAATEETA